MFSLKKHRRQETIAVIPYREALCAARMVSSAAGERSLAFSAFPSFSGGISDEALTSFIQENELGGGNCVAVIPVNTYQVIQADLSHLPEAEKFDAARWQIRDSLDYPPEEAIIDIFDVEPFGGQRKPLSYVVASPKTALHEYVRLLKKAGLRIQAIDIPEFALRNICDLFHEEERGTALLWLDRDQGMLAIVRDGSLFLARSFNVGMADLLPYADGDYELLTEKLDSIVLEIQRSFDFCESTFQLPIVPRLLVAQTGREIPAVVTYLNEYLISSVSALDFSGVLQIPEGVTQLELNSCLPAIGGALRQELTDASAD